MSYLDWIKAHSMTLDGRFNGATPAVVGRSAIDMGGVPLTLGEGGFKSPYDESDPAAVAEAAREAAALRTRSGTRRAGAFGPGGSSPVALGGMLSSSGLLGAPGAQPPADLPPPTNDPQAQEPDVFKNGVPLPRPKPMDGLNGAPQTAGAPMSLAPQDTAAMPTAEPAAGVDMSARAAPPTAAAPAPPAGGGFLERLSAGLAANPSTLLALGAGFSGAPSLGTGMRRAFGAATPAVAADRANQLKMGGVSATYRALVAKGVPPAEALAAVYNPDVMKATAAKYFETKPRTSVKIGTKMDGTDIMGSFDPNTGKFYTAAGDEVKGSGTGGVDPVGGGMQVLAKGVKDYNSDLPADQYLEQFGPEVKAAIKSYVSGDTMPTGNPRLKSLATNIKTWAQTYGDKAGVPVSDATYSARRTFRTQLGSASASAVGGQVKAFNQGIEHADALATKLEQLNNSGGLGIPIIASGVNATRQALSTKQSSIAAEAAAIGQTLAGEVGKLFSGAAGGGVHERELTRKRFDTVKSPPEMAAALEATLETMEGGLRALEQRRDEVMGPNSGIELVNKETHAKIAKIREAVARMKGEAPAKGGAAAAPGVTSSGIKWSVQ
ncbi:MAG: hypothetical protein WC670_19380 [Pseudolabrys sp.]|jgi:hypothetical protein